MTEHLHSTYQDGCYRCALSREEAHDSMIEELAELRAVVEAVGDALAGDEQAVVKVAAAQQVLIDAGLS